MTSLGSGSNFPQNPNTNLPRTTITPKPLQTEDGTLQLPPGAGAEATTLENDLSLSTPIQLKTIPLELLQSNINFISPPAKAATTPKRPTDEGKKKIEKLDTEITSLQKNFRNEIKELYNEISKLQVQIERLEDELKITGTEPKFGGQDPEARRNAVREDIAKLKAAISGLVEKIQKRQKETQNQLDNLSLQQLENTIQTIQELKQQIASEEEKFKTEKDKFQKAFQTQFEDTKKQFLTLFPQSFKERIKAAQSPYELELIIHTLSDDEKKAINYSKPLALIEKLKKASSDLSQLESNFNYKKNELNSLINYSQSIQQRIITKPPLAILPPFLPRTLSTRLAENGPNWEADPVLALLLDEYLKPVFDAVVEPIYKNPLRAVFILVISRIPGVPVVLGVDMLIQSNTALKKADTRLAELQKQKEELEKQNSPNNQILLQNINEEVEYLKHQKKIIAIDVLMAVGMIRAEVSARAPQVIKLLEARKANAKNATEKAKIQEQIDTLTKKLDEALKDLEKAKAEVAKQNGIKPEESNAASDPAGAWNQIRKRVEDVNADIRAHEELLKEELLKNEPSSTHKSDLQNEINALEQRKKDIVAELQPNLDLLKRIILNEEGGGKIISENGDVLNIPPGSRLEPTRDGDGIMILEPTRDVNGNMIPGKPIARLMDVNQSGKGGNYPYPSGYWKIYDPITKKPIDSVTGKPASDGTPGTHRPLEGDFPGTSKLPQLRKDLSQLKADLEVANKNKTDAVTNKGNVDTKSKEFQDALQKVKDASKKVQDLKKEIQFKEAQVKELEALGRIYGLQIPLASKDLAELREIKEGLDLKIVEIELKINSLKAELATNPKTVPLESLKSLELLLAIQTFYNEKLDELKAIINTKNQPKPTAPNAPTPAPSPVPTVTTLDIPQSTSPITPSVKDINDFHVNNIALADTENTTVSADGIILSDPIPEQVPAIVLSTPQGILVEPVPILGDPKIMFSTQSGGDAKPLEVANTILGRPSAEINMFRRDLSLSDVVPPRESPQNLT